MKWADDIANSVGFVEEGVCADQPARQRPLTQPYPVCNHGLGLAQAKLGRHRRGQLHARGGRCDRRYEGGFNELVFVCLLISSCAWCISCEMCSPRSILGRPDGTGCVEGRVCHGTTRIDIDQDRDGISETQGYGQMSQGGHRRNNYIFARRLFSRASQMHPRQEHDRTAHLGDPQGDASGGRVPLRQKRSDAHQRKNSSHHRRRLVHPPLLWMRPVPSTPYRKRTDHRAHDKQKKFAQNLGHYLSF